MLNNKIKIIFLILIVILSVSCTKEQQEDRSLQKIKESGIIVIGTHTTIEPMTYLDESGNNIGYDIDVIKEIAKKLGVEPKFQSIFFPELFDAVGTGEIDVAMSAITITAERSKKNLFSTPYFNNGQIITIRKENVSNIKGLEDLNNVKIGVLEGTTSAEAVSELENVNQSLVKVYTKSSAMVEDELIAKEIDVMVSGHSGIIGLLRKRDDLMVVGEPFTQEYYGIMTKKDNNALMEEINSILRDMKRERKLKEIEEKWFNSK